MAELDKGRMEESWMKCNEILSCMTSFSPSACNTLQFLQALSSHENTDKNPNPHENEMCHSGSQQPHNQQGVTTAGDDNVGPLSAFDLSAFLSADMAFNWNDSNLAPDDLGFLGRSDFPDFPGWFSDGTGL